MKDTVVGVYMIENSSNNKIYIGVSVDIKNRFMNHKTLLRNNKHPNKLMQNDYNKLGIEGKTDMFLYSVLEEGINTRKIDEAEKYYIEKYDSMENGYNSRFASNYGKSDKNKSKANRQAIIKERKMWSIEKCRMNSKLSVSEMANYLGVSEISYKNMEETNDFKIGFKFSDFCDRVDVPSSFIFCSINGKDRKKFDFESYIDKYGTE